MNLELRPARIKDCPIDGCDWKLITAVYVGGPHRVDKVPTEVQMQAAEAHMVGAHNLPGRTIIT